MKKALFFTILFFIQINCLKAQSVGDTFSIDGIGYKVTKLNPVAEVKTESYSGDSKAVIIPEKVLNEGQTYNVVSIGDLSFERKGLTSVTIPNTVRNIGNYAFILCSLTSVTIPSSVTNIGNFAMPSAQIRATVSPIAAFEKRLMICCR